jgi:hypothetical protein
MQHGKTTVDLQPHFAFFSNSNLGFLQDSPQIQLSYPELEETSFILSKKF